MSNIDTGRHPLRFGVWTLVHGSRAALQDPDEPYDASWERNRKLILEAEQLGYEATLVAQHLINPYVEGLDQLENWTAAAALAALTSKIEIIAAIKPKLFHPVVLAKLALQIEHISGGRFSINLINGWNRAEFEKAGIEFSEHDERYAYGREWISVVSRLIAGEKVYHQGQHFQIDGYQLHPANPYRKRSPIYLGGESEPAKALVAEHGDVYFINGQPVPDVQAIIRDVAARPRLGNPGLGNPGLGNPGLGAAPVRFGLAAFVISRETEAEAQAELRRLFELAAKDVALKAAQKGNVDPKVIMKQTLEKFPHVGTNGGTGAGLVGDYDTVARRVIAFRDIGIELFMLQFQPFEAEMRRFAKEVIPRVRDLEAGA